MRLRLLVLVGMLLALVACGTDRPAPVPAHVAPGPAAAAAPAHVRVPAIGADSTLIETGLNPDGTIEVPPVEQPEQASWYRESPRPGDAGPAILLGHVDGHGRPGVFHDLTQLIPGDEVLVDRADGSTARFAVYAVEHHDKDAFPTAQVYGDTAGPELRLITCGGAFVGGEQGYADNVIAFARLAEGTP